MWISARNIAENLKTFYKTDKINISISDGPDAAQSVPHCHIHLIPIPEGYDWSKAKSDSERKPRTQEEMAEEAEKYRNCFVFN